MKTWSMILAAAFSAAILGVMMNQISSEGDPEMSQPATHENTTGHVVQDVTGENVSLAHLPSVIPMWASLPPLSASGQQELSRHYAGRRIANQGDAEAKRGNWTQAADHYRQSLALWPANPTALYGLGRCADATGDTATAIKYYRTRIYKNHVSRDVTAPDDGYREPNNDRLMEFVLLLDKAGQVDEALSVYHYGAHLYNYDPLDPTKRRDVLLPEFGPGEWAYTPQRLRAMAHLALSLYYRGHGLGNDVPHLQESLALAPDSAVAQFYLAQYLSAKNDPGAKAAYQKASDLDESESKNEVGSVAQKRLDFMR